MLLRVTKAGRCLTVPLGTYVVASYGARTQPYRMGITSLRVCPDFGAAVFLWRRPLKDKGLSGRLVVAYVSDFRGAENNQENVENLLEGLGRGRAVVQGALVVKNDNARFGLDLLARFRASGIETTDFRPVLDESPVGINLMTGRFFLGWPDGGEVASQHGETDAEMEAFARGRSFEPQTGSEGVIRLLLDLG